MKDEEIVKALRCCASGESEEECPFTEKYGRDGCPKVSADLIERLTAENAKAVAERDALLKQIKARRSCLDCKHFDYCEFFDDATVIDCMSCVTKNCPCHQCSNSSHWEWRGLPDAPEEIKAPFTEDTMINLAAQALGVEAARLRELAEADKDGRVVVKPCKVGDKLYAVTGRKTISVYRVKAIRVELFGLFIEWDLEEGFAWQSLAGVSAGEIGKTVFLSREEAEKALQEMEGKKDGCRKNQQT